MAAKSKYRGHCIECIDDNWVYSDTKDLVEENTDRLCGNCEKENTVEGHDPCLGTLPGVMNACCGHGNESGAYVQFWDGTDIRGAKALEWFIITAKGAIR